MDDTSTGIFGNEVTSDDTETPSRFPVFKEIEQRLVGGAYQLLSLKSGQDLVFGNLSLLGDYVIHSTLQADVFNVVLQVLKLHVLKGRVDGTRQVRRQSPGGGGPGN